MRRASLRYSMVSFALLALAPAHAFAQASPASEETRSAARALASEGLRAYQAGNDAEAIDRFGRAESLVHAPPHVLYLARASARTGKLVQAKEHYVRIVREELPATAPKAFSEAQKSAGAELAALEPKIPSLTITVSGASAADTTVMLDGAEMNRALIDVAAPVNPGHHVLRASAPGWEDVETAVDIAEGGRERATLAFTKAALSSADVDAKPSTVKKVAPWIAFGVGAVGLGLGTVFLLQNRSDRESADSICGDARCPGAKRAEVQDLDSSANRASTFAWIGFGVAAAGAITGAALLVTQRHPSRPRATGTTRTTVVPWLGPGSAGLTGEF